MHTPIKIDTVEAICQNGHHHFRFNPLYLPDKLRSMAKVGFESAQNKDRASTTLAIDQVIVDFLENRL